MVRIGNVKVNVGADVASTASMTLGAGNFFNITGTTTITSITAKPSGTVVTIEFASFGCQVTDGGNIHLDGDFRCLNSGGRNNLTLISDGTDWIEIARYPGSGISYGEFFTRDMTIATGTQVFSGVGFRPNSIFFHCVQDGGTG